MIKRSFVRVPHHASVSFPSEAGSPFHQRRSDGQGFSSRTDSVRPATSKTFTSTAPTATRALREKKKEAGKTVRQKAAQFNCKARGE